MHFLTFNNNPNHILSWITILHNFCGYLHVNVSNMNDTHFYLYLIPKYNTFSQTVRQSVIIWQWQVIDCLNWLVYLTSVGWLLVYQRMYRKLLTKHRLWKSKYMIKSDQNVIPPEKSHKKSKCQISCNLVLQFCNKWTNEQQVIAELEARKQARFSWAQLNTLRQRQNGRHFADAIFKCIFMNENVWILKFHLILFLMVQLTILQNWFR